MVAGKVVPAHPGPRRGIPAASVRGADARWRPGAGRRSETDGWASGTLRASGGFTARANSVLPLGDPGMPLDEAIGQVVRWYDGSRAARRACSSYGARSTRLLERGAGGRAGRRSGTR